MTGAQWVLAIDRVMAMGPSLTGEPSQAEAPCYHTVKALDASDLLAVPFGDPLCESARWEWVAWAAIRLRIPHALDVARLACSLADECACEVVT